VGTNDRVRQLAASLRTAGLPSGHLERLIREACEPVDDFRADSLAGLVDRIGACELVLIGEASHGTHEFYAMRARLTQELILRKGFDFVAIEGDWPDVARIDRYVRHRPAQRETWTAFSRFPTWMWRNRETAELVEWLRALNEERDRDQRVGFHGLDLYSLFTSAKAVIEHLSRIDPPSAAIARERYGCLMPWENHPERYGRAVLNERYGSCEKETVAMLRELLARRLEHGVEDSDLALDAVANARVVANAERYYRSMYLGSRESWNLRDAHMFDMLTSLLNTGGRQRRGIVWAHNSHLGDASATEMGARGEWNVGQLVREAHGDAAYLIGFGTDHGTVAAASEWDGPMEEKRVRPSHPLSHEALCHASGVPVFLLPLREPNHDALRDELGDARLERAIGVIYRPETELASHYFQAVLPKQFDEYIWFDETRAITPLAQPEPRHTVPDTYPFGL
jgi:protein-L-isoaspartate(D-aspartate) O-methyltransferase